MINNNRFSIILKGRQVFMSTILAAYTAWSILNGKKIGIYANKRDMSNNFITKVRMILLNYGAKFQSDRRDFIELKDIGGSVKGLSTPTGFCGWRFDELIFDEAAFIDRFDEALSIGTIGLSPGGKIILSSTPNGLETFFNTWEGSRVGDNDYKRIKITYKDVPIYDEEWVERMKRSMNYDKKWIEQELYANFVLYEQPKKNKNKLIQFRINDETYMKLLEKLIEKDVNVSKYMRDLILKDVDK